MIKIKHNLEDWWDRLDQALEYRFTYGHEIDWALLENMYSNLKDSGADAGPNLIQEMGDALVSRLGVGNPVIGVSPSPLDPRSVETYPIIQSIDNWLMSELEIPTIMQDLILHSYLWGPAICKIGYDSEFGYSPKHDVGEEEALGLTLTQFSQRGYKIEHGPARPGMPWVLPVLPHDFLVPWGVKYLRWAPWCAHRVIRHIDDFKADVKYSNKQKVEPNMSMSDFTKSYTNPMAHFQRKRGPYSISFRPPSSLKGNEYLELWEIHSAIDGKIVVISDQGVHRLDDDVLQVDGLPFMTFSFTQHPRTFWATPQAQYMKIHQAEQNDITIQASKQRRMSNWKLLIKTGAMETTEIERMISADSGAVGFMNAGFDKEDIITMPTPNLLSLYQDAEFVRRNARESLGFSRNQLGEFDASSRRTATEATLVAQGSDFRMERRSVAVEKMYKDIFRFLNQITFTFWKRPRVIQVEGGAWPTYTGEEIRSEHSLKVSFGLDKPRDPESRIQQAIGTYQLFINDPYVDQLELRRFLVRVFSDVEFGRLFSDQALQKGQVFVEQQKALQEAQQGQQVQ